MEKIKLKEEMKRLRNKGGKFVVGKPKTGGRKAGTKNKKTIDRERALESYQQQMLGEMLPLIRAQQAAAKGLVVVLRPRMVKNAKGKLERTGEMRQVKDPAEIEELFNSSGVGVDYHIIWAKDPNVKALKDIWEMVFGKAPQSLEIEHKGKVILLDK